MRSRLLVDRERYQYHTTTCRHQEDTERMGPPLVDAVSSRSREAAVETVIDMDPNGAAHRMARTKNASLLSALRDRPNRITDGALFAAAHALGKYEIALDSPEVLDLYGQESHRRSRKLRGCDKNDTTIHDEQTKAASTDNTTAEGEFARTTTEEPALRQGWEARILRHHDKIIRAKNNANPTNAMGEAAAASSPMGGVSFKSSSTTTQNAMPPPALISALRKIFGSASASSHNNLQDLLSSIGEISGTTDGDNNISLPSLLHAVLNHQVFVSTSSIQTPTAADDNIMPLNTIRHTRTSSGASNSSRRDRRRILCRDGDGRDERRDTDGEVRHSRDFSGATYVDGGEDKEDGTAGEPPLTARSKIMCVPSAANLESILGNACRDILHKSGTQNSRLQGLLIAALSVTTGCLITQEELESMNFGGVMEDLTPSTTTAPTPRYLDSSNAADPFTPLLQVGALLASFPTSDETTEFALDRQLLRYFATASSLYEERIEIQKANLFQRQMPSPPPMDALKAAQLLPLPHTSSLQESNSNVLHEVLTSTNDGVGISAESSSIAHSDQLNNAEGGTHIDLVPASDDEGLIDSGPIQGNDNSPAPSDDDDDDDDDDDYIDENDDTDEDDGLDEEDPNAEDDSSESDHDEDTNSCHEESDDDEDEDEDDDGELEDENLRENDDEDEDFQRALTLSLVPAADTDSSDESHSDDDACSHRSDDPHSGGDADSSTSDAVTEAAAGNREAPTVYVISSSATVETSVTTPPPQASSEAVIENTSSQKSDKPATLPPLPSPPPLCTLPSHDHASAHSDMNTSSIFEPSALSSFGKLPPSHVLVHLFLAILEIIQELCSSPEKDDDNSIPDAKHAAADEKDTLHTEELNVIGDAHGKTQFLLNSTTASLLIASLQLSSQLRDSALKSLNDSIISSDEAFNASMIMGDVGRIQIAHTSALERSEVDDPLIEKDDPAGLESAASSSGFEAESSAKDNSESLESKGLNRKAAAAVQIACLRSETKQKFVQTLTNRVALYSTCCILNLKCFRVLIGKSMENAGVASSSGKNSLNAIETEVDENPVSDVLSLSTKTRLSLLQLLSNFYGSAASRNFQSLKLSMINFYRRNDETLLPRVESLGDQLLVAELCNESLCLWGYAMPALYSDHQARVELLGNMLEALLSSTSAPIEIDDFRYNIAASNNSIKSCTWSDYEMQCWKIDIVCKRLRVSDMLDSFVAAPIIDGIDAKVKFDQTKEKSNLRPSTTASPTTSDRQTSLRILSLLSKSILKQSPGDGESNNLTKFYLALFQRLTTVLILWNDLSISSIDANDHDISGGESSFNAGSFGGIGSYRGDGDSLQINPNPESFHFDSTKCADSVSLTSSSLSLPITANQRATKVWGTVLSTTCFLPKSGVHRWAIRLDKCERGHVFVGVSTARTNLKTYVGGDSHGWGLIGTQALWHDRSKLRGDYGSTFRTGAVVVVTLDTNVGTLSFGLWKDGTSTPDSTHTPVSTHSLIGSPRRLPLHGHTGGGPFIEDWGIAFEGLPLDVKLYPAVGLYQRDDRVTLCTVSKPNVCRRGLPTSSLSLPCGDLYFPALSNNEEEKYNLFVRSWNQTLCFDGVSFATEILGRAIQQLMSCDSLLTTGDVLLTEILPCLASSICLIPSCIPTLSVQYAMELLPFITRCAKAIDNFIQSKDSPIGINMREGEWSIFTSSASEGTSTLSGSSKRSLESSEEYAVNIQPKIMQHEATEYFSYEGKSLNNEMTVIGASYGSRVYLVENTCTPESQKRERTSRGETAQISSESCIIDARLSLDGASFEGVRYRVEKGSSDRVSGFLQQPSVTKASDPNDLMKHLIQSECLLSLAVGHLSLILCSQTSMSDIYNDVGNNVEKKSLDSLLSRSLILSRGLLDYDRSSQRRAVHSTWDRCKSGNTHSEIRDHWEDTIYNDLLRPADKLKDNTMKMEDAMTILEQQTTTSWADRMGSLSRLCPEKYATAQKSIASAIFYHTYRSSSDSMPDIVSKAIQYSLPILENGVREALIRAGDGVRFNSVCEDHCSLLVLIAQFLFEFSCLADTNLSTHCVLDDIALITKSIHSEEDLNYIKQKMRVRTEQSIMQCVGLRSLHFLLQPEVGLKGVCVHVAVEAALVSLPRLLCSSAMELSSDLQHNHEPSNHFSSRIAGCTDTIQSLIHLGIRNIYAHVGSILEDSVYQVTKSSTLGLLACCFSDVHPNEYYDIVLNVLPSLRVMSDRCRKQIMNTGTNLLDIICNHENQRLLETSAAILMVSCYQLSHSSSNSSGVDVLNENLIHEIIETIVLVIEDATMISECEEKQAVLSDWITCHTSLGSKPATTHPAVAAAQESSKNLSERIVATLNRAVQSEAQSAVYLTQVLDVLHVAINTQSIIPGISKKSGALLSSLGFIVTIGGEGSDSSPTMHRLPLRFKRRLLRLLRPILLATNADSSVIRQLFFMAGTNVQGTRIAVLSSEDMLISQSSISLLRHLYMFSSSWRHVIHQHMTARDSDELLHGILTFIGGAPGSLVHGGFVVIDTEAASLSSSKVGSTKTRQSNELAGIHLNAISTSGVGAEEIAVGLRRHNSLSGVVSSIDSQHGTCEVILLDPNRSESNSTTRETRTITRAIHVSAAHVSAADELPLYIDATNLPAMDIFIQLSDTFKHISTIISSKSHNPGSAITQDTDAHALMECSQGLRSITVLTSEPKLLHKYVGHESGRLRFLLAQALLIGTAQISNAFGLSSLPSLEARVGHLLLMRLEVRSRTKVLDHTSPVDLKTLFEDLSSTEILGAKVEGTGNHTLPSKAEVNTSVGQERSFRTGSSRDVSSNVRREGVAASSSLAAEQDDEDGDTESSDADAAAHLREAAIVQMAELGLPRQWAELALSRVGGTNIEAAVHFCLERGGDMERLLAEETQRRGPSSFVSGRRRAFGVTRLTSSNLIRQLAEMGFPQHWCVEALTATGNNVDEALTWILMNGDRLTVDDEAVEEEHDEDTGNDDDDDESEEDEVENDENHDDNDNDEEEEVCTANNIEHGVDDRPVSRVDKSGWSDICPVRCVFGRPDINPISLEVVGSPSGESSAVGTKGILLTAGKWYYEVEVKTAGCIHIGWADSSFSGHSQIDQSDGCGNGPHTWTYDGWRRYRWHGNATDWGCKWNTGDIVGCLCDMDSMRVKFTLNGKGEEIGMGLAFSDEGFRPSHGVYAYVCLNRREQARLIIGGKDTEPFKYPLPDGYCGVGEAILDAVQQRDILLEEERVLETEPSTLETKKKYLIECSDGEHGHELFAWQHRYYGSDASVHLGPSRPSIFGVTRTNLKPSKGDSTKNVIPMVADLSSRMSKIRVSANDHAKSSENIIACLRGAYEKIYEEIESELKEMLTQLCVLYAQKLVMHVLISSSNQFDVQFFIPTSLDSLCSEVEHLEVSQRLWQVTENCTSLQTAGWVGEAGAMAVAAEALGLGISTGGQKINSIPDGMCTVSASGDPIYLACGGVAQFLTAATSRAIANDEITSTAWTFAACAENAVGRGVGGSLPFIKTSLQSAAASSPSFRAILLATVRRATRILSAVEYGAIDGVPLEDDSEDRERSDEDAHNAPDARLVSFLTGLLLSEPVSSRLSDIDNEALRCGLFEAWCVGLLSASSPWRMVSGFTAAGILNLCPQALTYATSRTPIIARRLGALESKVTHRTWSERAAIPVVSRNSQALLELLASVKRARRVLPSSCALGDPLESTSNCANWECSEGWIVSNETWDIWIGTVELMEVDWQPPGRSSAHTLMDSGNGPPMLRESHTVMRGIDWDSGNDDGRDIYEQDKLEKEKLKLAAETEQKARCAEENQKKEITSDEHAAVEPNPANPASEDNPAEVSVSQIGVADATPEVEIDKDVIKEERKQKRIYSSKLPLGTVLSIEPWNGIPASARKVRWHLNGKEGIYRYGGDGGCFDLVHVETNEKETRVKKKYPVPESHEQCAFRCGFGLRRMLSIILRLNKQSLNSDHTKCDGILEWPDFGACVRVECTFYSDGAISVTEREVLYGSADSGWEPRFGQPNFVPGQTMVISSTRNSKSCDDSELEYEEFLGSNSFLVQNLRKKEDGGGPIRVTSEMRIRRARQSSGDSPLSSSHLSSLCFDPEFHASSIALSKDMKSVTCSNSERGVAFGNVGFTKGVHYWEVKLEKAEIGSVFIGVAEKPSCLESQPKLNRWLGWGFVNFRATYASGAERVYGVHCHAGDTIGVLLDCDSGRINYFIDGVKYGEHILNDLGCAFENISPMGFDSDGCGSGGAAQGAPSAVDVGRNGRYHANSVVQPKALWPVIGLRNPGDRVTMSSKWMTSHGVDDTSVVKNICAVDEVLCAYEHPKQSILTSPTPDHNRVSFPQWFVAESFNEYNRWASGIWLRCSTRGSGPCKLSSYSLDADLDISPLACAAACASLGLPIALLHGDRVDVKRSAGRILELQEEAVVLGAYQGRLFYRIVSQKSEGGSLTEGGGRSWFWDESEAVEGGLVLIGEGLGRSVSLPKLRRFAPRCGGLKVIYPDGAVVRPDLEFFEGSAVIGTIAFGTIVPSEQIIERRRNSCGVARYLIECEPFGRGWISSRIRGGKEEQIVELIPVCADEEGTSSCEAEYITPEDSAKEWYKKYTHELEQSSEENGGIALVESIKIRSIQEFGELLTFGVIDGMSELESDSLLAFTYERVCDTLPISSEGGCSFQNCASVLCAAQPCRPAAFEGMHSSLVQEVANEALSHVLDKKLPSTQALMARISMLRALNRRARYALPWLPLRPPQECSAILGGLSGYGSSLERAGRSWDTKAQSLWVQTPSISSRLRSCKKILFPSTTKYFLDSVLDATTSPTPLSHDEYELPREIRTVRVNRLKARRAMASDNNNLKKKHSVFSQIQKDINGWSGATLRRGFVAKGHGGQKRAFKVKLVGEGVNDYSGPYREVFTDSMREITDLDALGNSSLGVLQPTPNNRSDVGDGRDLFVFAFHSDHHSNLNEPAENDVNMLSSEEKDLLNSFTCLTIKTDESYREIEEALIYLGKLVGTACRHGIPVDLPLPLGVVWDRLTEENYNVAEIVKEIDILAFKALDAHRHHTAPSTYDFNLASQRRLLNAFAEGLSSVVPLEIVSMFTGTQLRDIICGNPDIDVELLRRVVEYEGYTENDTVVTYFWDVLREMTTSERKLFLQFVWARSRLPLKANDFEAPFLIQKDTKDVNENGDYPLPSASTCFFSLSLPDYPSKEVLQQKLLYAIENVTTMESDFVTNDAEISEGWRGL